MRAAGERDQYRSSLTLYKISYAAALLVFFVKSLFTPKLFELDPVTVKGHPDVSTVSRDLQFWEDCSVGYSLE